MLTRIANHFMEHGAMYAAEITAGALIAALEKANMMPTETIREYFSGPVQENPHLEQVLLAGGSLGAIHGVFDGIDTALEKHRQRQRSQSQSTTFRAHMEYLEGKVSQANQYARAKTLAAQDKAVKLALYIPTKFVKNTTVGAGVALSSYLASKQLLDTLVQ